MRFGRFGASLFVAGIALSAGCATAPSATSRPTESAVLQASPSLPSSSASPRPDSSVPAGSPRPTATPAPVVLEASGATRGVAIGGAMPFVALDGGRARCQSAPDSQAVAGVTALELGELGSGLLRATLGLAAQTSGAASVELFIAGGLAEGAFQPFWTGPVKVTASHGGGASGTVTFSRLKLEVAAGSKPGMSPLPGIHDWPATLSGALSWSCEPWTIPAPSIAP
jgi:hypothetical protein